MRRGPSYRVAEKVFALQRPWNDWLAVGRQIPEGSREILLEAEPTRFFIPLYFGAKGWIGLGLDEKAGLGEIEAFARPSFRPVAPRRFARLVA